MKKNKWIIIFVISIVILGFSNQGEKIMGLEREKENLLKEKAAIEKEVAVLKKEITYLNDNDNIAAVARENLSMIFPSETLFIKVQDK